MIRATGLAYADSGPPMDLAPTCGSLASAASALLAIVDVISIWTIALPRDPTNGLTQWADAMGYNRRNDEIRDNIEDAALPRSLCGCVGGC